MDDDAIIDLILQGSGISPSDPRYATYRAALKAQAAAASASQGREFDESARRFDEDLDYKQRSLDQQYKIARLSADNQQEVLAVDRWYKEQSLALSREQLALNAELGRGRLSLDTELGRGGLEIQRGAQGLGILDKDVALRQKPASWTALADYEAGIEANPFAVSSIRSLLDNAAASYTAPGAPSQRSGMPQQGGLAATLAKMGVGTAAAPAAPAAAASGGGGAGAVKDVDPRVAGIQAIAKNYVPSGTQGWDDKDANTIQAIAALAQIGEGKYANRYGQMDEDDQQILLGGMGYLGRNPERVARIFDQKRVGNSASGLAA